MDSVTFTCNAARFRTGQVVPVTDLNRTLMARFVERKKAVLTPKAKAKSTKKATEPEGSD